MNDSTAASVVNRYRFSLPLIAAALISLAVVAWLEGAPRLAAMAGTGALAAVGLVGLVDRRGLLDGFCRWISLVAAATLGLVWGLAAVELLGRETASAPLASFQGLALLFAGGALPVFLALAYPGRVPVAQLAFLVAQAGTLGWLLDWRRIFFEPALQGLAAWVIGTQLVALLCGWVLARLRKELLALRGQRDEFEARLEQTRNELEEAVQARDAVSHELTVTRNQAEIADVAKTEFLATISHEIRTPLNGILPILEMLRESDLETEQRQHVDTALSSSRHLLRIINDILDYSKIEAGKLELESINLNLREVVQAVTTLLSKSAERKGLKIKTIVHDDVPLFVSGDPIRLRQILINLVGNAIKFTNQGGVSVEVINQRSGRRIVDLLFIVRDTGIGMSPKTASKLFQSFSQADASTTRKHGGSGLGLAICKRLVELMGGSIGVRSQQGVGSLFWFQIPFRRTLEVNEHRANLGNARVLVLTEDSAWRRRLDALLGRWGVMKAIANSAEEAVAKVTSSAHLGFSWTYEAIIIDARSLHGDIAVFIAELRRLTEMDDLKILLLGDRTQIRLPDEAEGYVEILGDKCSDNDIRQALNHLLGVGQATTEQTWWHDDMPESAALADELADQAGLAESPLAEPSRVENGVRFHGRVLVAEDNPVNLAVIVRLLSKLGLEVERALDGAEAVRMIGSESFDLVFMDCQMPGVDGYEATRIVRGREQEADVEQRVPIIAMTANAMPGDRERCLQCGMDDYLSKPVDRTSLQQLLARWLREDELEAPSVSRTETMAVTRAECPIEASEETAETRASEDAMAAGAEVISLADARERSNEPRETPKTARDVAARVLDGEVLDELREIMEDEFPMLLKRYLDTAPAQLKNLDEALLRARLADVARIAHSLKSSCANVGAMSMSEQAKKLELAAKENNQIRCLELILDLRREARLVEMALHRLLEDEQAIS